MAKHRSSQDYAATYAGFKNGIGIGIENFLHVKQESTAGTFVAPSVGTQGSSLSAATPSADITGSSNRNGRINVDGTGVTAFGLSSVTGLDTGAEIAAALETAINSALSTAGLDARVWAEYASSRYKIWSQKTGATSSVVITNGASLDLMTELKLGTANSGTEAAGTAGGDFLQATKIGLQMSQPFEMSEHKSGRQSTNVIKQKKVGEGEVEMYVNLPASVAAFDTALALFLEATFGKKTVTGATSVKFDNTQPRSLYMSAVQGNNAFNRVVNGMYSKKWSLSIPGSGAAKMTVPTKFRDAKYATIAQINGAVAGAAAVVLNNGESPGFDVGARVMIVDDDGRTVVAGADGGLTVDSRTDGSHQLNLSASVTVDDNGYVVPWCPHVFDQVGTDNPAVSLNGSVSFDGGSTTIEEIKQVDVDFDPKTTDFDDWYGADGNRGGVDGDKSEITVTVQMLLSASQVRKIVQAKEFTQFAVTVILGLSSSVHAKLTFPVVQCEVPPVPIPDNGPVIIELRGKALQSANGRLNAITLEYVYP